MKVKRIAIDISKHAFTLHGVDDQERPVLRRDLKRAEVETELRVDAGGLGPAQDDHRSRRQARHAVNTVATSGRSLVWHSLAEAIWASGHEAALTGRTHERTRPEPSCVKPP